MRFIYVTTTRLKAIGQRMRLVLNNFGLNAPRVRYSDPYVRLSLEIYSSYYSGYIHAFEDVKACSCSFHIAMTKGIDIASRTPRYLFLPKGSQYVLCNEELGRAATASSPRMCHDDIIL